jgi:tetratricopeptide (TPR) repeat protein
VARRQGRLIYPIAPQLEAVLASLEQGYPVLVMQNRGLRIFPLKRFAVVVGADRAQEKFLLRMGVEERLEIPFEVFERNWARADYWGMLVLDPSTVPDSLDPRMVVRELALLEHEGALAEAQQGFNEAVLNWPEQKPAWLGLASTSMRLGQLERAEATLRELVRRAPGYGAGLNNLADLLLKTGRPMEALPLAEQAVAVLDVPTTRATLQAAHQAVAPLQSQALPPIAGEKPVEAVGKPAEIRKKAAVSHNKKKAGRKVAKKHNQPAAKAATSARKAGAGAATTAEAAPTR